MNKKDEVLTEIFLNCKKSNNYVFDNDLVKDVSKKYGFGNPFDATKIDNKSKLPEILLDNDFAVIHLGSGRHQFIKGINKFYHPFLYYYHANEHSDIKGKIKEIFGVYVVKTIENKVTNLKLWAYTFENPLDITSIKFVKSMCFKLIV